MKRKWTLARKTEEERAGCFRGRLRRSTGLDCVHKGATGELSGEGKVFQSTHPV